MRTQCCPWRTLPSAAARASPWAPASARQALVPVQGPGQGLVMWLQARARWAAAAASARITELFRNTVLGNRQGPRDGLEALQAHLLASALPPAILQGLCHGVLQHRCCQARAQLAAQQPLRISNCYKQAKAINSHIS